MIKIPEKILIGDKEYKIKTVKRVDLFNSDISGKIMYGLNLMKIRDIKDPKEKESLFFHEVSHGIMRELEFNHPRVNSLRNNERFIEELGLILRKTFIDLVEKQNGLVQRTV